MWIDAAIFYLFSAFFIISYLRLVLTDISSKNFATSVDEENNTGAGTGQQKAVCPKCNVVWRADMFHCSSCGCCCEFYDHHCDVIQICVCATNYKFFILFLMYGGMTCLAMLISFAHLT